MIKYDHLLVSKLARLEWKSPTCEPGMWSWGNHTGRPDFHWVPYDPDLNATIEAAYQSRRTEARVRILVGRFDIEPFSDFSAK